MLPMAILYINVELVVSEAGTTLWLSNIGLAGSRHKGRKHEVLFLFHGLYVFLGKAHPCLKYIYIILL